MSSFDWKKKVEESLKDGLIITATMTGILHVLKAANVTPSKASLDAMDVMKLARGIVGGALVKSTKNGSKSDTTTKFYSP